MTNVTEIKNVLETQLETYEDAKKRLIVRPINWNRQTRLLNEETPFLYKKIGKDLILAVYILFDDDQEIGVLSTGVLPLALTEKWEEDEDMIFNQALENTQNYAQARLYTNIFDIENTPERQADFLAEEFPANIIKRDATLLVTTKRKTNGAIAMFYPKVKERLAELLGGNFYVAFTSIHEAMIHREGVIDPVSIRRNVTETNRIFGPEETCTNEVWFFDQANGTFQEI